MLLPAWFKKLLLIVLTAVPAEYPYCFNRTAALQSRCVMYLPRPSVAPMSASGIPAPFDTFSHDQQRQHTHTVNTPCCPPAAPWKARIAISTPIVGAK